MNPFTRIVFTNLFSRGNFAITGDAHSFEFGFHAEKYPPV